MLRLCLTLCLAVLILPSPGQALTKQEVRERSLKRLERVSEKIKGSPQEEEEAGSSLGRPYPAVESEPARPAPSPPPAAAARPQGRAAERRTDEAVVLHTPAPVQAAPAATTAAAAPTSQPAQAAAAPSVQPVQAVQPAKAPEAPQSSAAAPAVASTPAPAPAPVASRPAVDPADRRQALELFQQALAAAKKDNYKKALSLLDKAAALDPTDPDIFNNRGNAHNNLGDTRKALADYNTAVTLRPADAAAHSNRGLAHERLGDDAAACRDYRTACDLGDCEFYESFRKEGRCPK
jgi:tetratricopeptide (TPR) repeat protein